MSDLSHKGESAKQAAESGFQNGVEAVKSTARDAAQTMRASASGAYSTGSELLREGADSALNASGAAASSLAAQIRSQPVAAAMVCLGVGFLAGIALSRRY